MSFKVFTDDAGTHESFGDNDKHNVGQANGVLDVERADGSRILFSPHGGWVRIEIDPRGVGVY